MGGYFRSRRDAFEVSAREGVMKEYFELSIDDGDEPFWVWDVGHDKSVIWGRVCFSPDDFALGTKITIEEPGRA